MPPSVCRIVGYYGQPIPLASVLADPPHSLIHQSYAPRELPDATHCGDGWGVAWFPSREPESPMGVFRTTRPLWNDENAKDMGHAVFAASLVANARLTLPNLEVTEVNTPVYTFEGRVQTENGGVDPWPGPFIRALRHELDTQAEAQLRGSTESEILAAIWSTLFRGKCAGDASAALREMIKRVLKIVRRHDGKIHENMLIAGPTELLAVRVAEGLEPHSLYRLDRGRLWPEGTVIASEPLDDDPGWESIPVGSLVRVDSSGSSIESLLG